MPTTKERKEKLKSFIEQQEGGLKPVDLVDFLCDEFPNYSRRENRRFIVQEFAGREPEEDKEELTKECPQCENTAEGEQEVDELFGFRQMKGGKKRIQSWCKECRNS